MFVAVKKFLYRRLSVENYLRTVQSGFFFAYRTGLLRFSRKFENHYFIKKLVSPGDTVIDIGANLGYYSIPLSRRVGKGGRVYAVEPISLYNQVFEKAARNRQNIVLLPYALGYGEGEITLVTNDDAGYLRTGLPHISRTGYEETGYIRTVVFPATMKRPSVLFRELEKVDFIKCDIEGLELEVLNEMKEIIARHRPLLQVEVWEENMQKLLDLFGGMDYIPFRLEKGRLIPVEKCSPDNQSDLILIPAEKTGSCNAILS